MISDAFLCIGAERHRFRHQIGCVRRDDPIADAQLDDLGDSLLIRTLKADLVQQGADLACRPEAWQEVFTPGGTETLSFVFEGQIIFVGHAAQADSLVARAAIAPDED